ncbi:hypothetical protein AFK24_29350 [Pseudomonas syringae]|uniref:Uncharacterized protein n=1 Tax=Pseudomonas syringae TaxID=317 RepID=A0A1C7YV87_PSESX|nr:hypothetical protein AFK24_29350 [Pseudomonas syringae]
MCLRLFEQCLKQELAQPLASYLTAQVNPKVSDTVIACASAIFAEARPTYNLIVIVILEHCRATLFCDCSRIHLWSRFALRLWLSARWQSKRRAGHTLE